MASYVLPRLGEWNNIQTPSKSTTTYAAGAWLYNDGTNDIEAISSSQVLRGITREAKVSASNTNPIMITTPEGADCAFEMDIGNGTIATTDVGKSFDLYNSTTVNASSTTYKPVKLVKFITTTKGWFVLNYAMGTNAS